MKQPLLIPILYNGKEVYQVVEDYEAPNWNRIIVPKGLVVDGASVPRIVWSFMPPDGLHRAGALVHDYLYILRGVLLTHGTYGDLNYDNFTKNESDYIFYNLMILAGVGKHRAGIAYKAVSKFGQKAWDSKESPIILPVLNQAIHKTKKIKLFKHLYEC